MNKKYIKIVAIFNEDGTLTPTNIIWDDNRKFSIDKILNIQKIANLKYGAIGTKYICKVHGKTISIYNEENNKWFIEQN